MALHRCAACGSPNVVTDTQNDGVKYNYVKGAVGTVLLGAGGAAAGIQSDNKQVFKCPDCGLTLNEPMAFEIKTLIDMGVMSAEARKNLKLQGVSIDWEVLTAKYKNIERSSFDTQNKNVQQSSNTAKTNQNPIVEQVDAEGSVENKKIYEDAQAKYEDDCEKWRIEIERIKEVRISKTEETFNAEYSRQRNELVSGKEQAIQLHRSRQIELTGQKQQAEAKLQSLGVFKFSEKRNLKSEIERLTQAIQEEVLATNKAKVEYDERMKVLEQQHDSLRKKISQKIDEENPFPRKPVKPDAMCRYNANGVENSTSDYVAYHMQNEIFRFVEKCDNVTFSDIKSGCKALTDLTENRIKGYVQALLDNNELREFGGKYFVKYGKSKAKAEAERAEKIEAALKSPEQRTIYEMLQKFPNEQFTLTQILEKADFLADFTHQRLAACLRRLSEAGLVKRFEENGKAYFKIAE